MDHFKEKVVMDKNWLTLTPRLAPSGLIPNDPKLIDRIVKAGSAK